MNAFLTTRGKGNVGFFNYPMNAFLTTRGKGNVVF